MRITCTRCQSGVDLPGKALLPEYVCPACRGDMPGTIGPYRILGFLGAGGMGQVYKALHPGLQRAVALKVFQVREGDHEFLERFRREARIVARLSHPDIVAVYDCGNDGNRHYLAMELIEGRPLKEQIPDGGIDPRRAAAITARLARAVHYAHERGVIHRDIKPSNILVDARDNVRLLDFGLSRSVGDESISVSGDVIGTPAYMSPEQAGADPKRVDARADVYSLGATLYDMLTGRPPIRAPSSLELLRRIPTEQPERPSRLRADLPPGIEELCLRALSKDPAKRFQTAAEFADALEKELQSPARARSAPRRKTLPALAGTAAGILLAVLLAFGLPRGSAPEPKWPAGVERARSEPSPDVLDPHLDSFATCDGLLHLAAPELFPVPVDWTAIHTAHPEDPRYFLAGVLHMLYSKSEDLAELELRHHPELSGSYLVLGIIAFHRAGSGRNAIPVRKWLSAFPPMASRRLLMLRALAEVGYGEPAVAPAGLPEGPEKNLLLAMAAHRSLDYRRAEELAARAQGEAAAIYREWLRLSEAVTNGHSLRLRLSPFAPGEARAALLIRAADHAIRGEWARCRAYLQRQDQVILPSLFVLPSPLEALRKARDDESIRISALELQRLVLEYDRAGKTCRELEATTSRAAHQAVHRCRALIAAKERRKKDLLIHLEAAFQKGYTARQARLEMKDWLDDEDVRRLLDRYP